MVQLEKYYCQDCNTRTGEDLRDVTYRNLPGGTWRDGCFCIKCIAERKDGKISEFGICNEIMVNGKSPDDDLIVKLDLE